MIDRVEGHLLSQLGMYDVEAPEGADLAMAVAVHPQVTNPRGGLQGGLVATLVDVTAGRAALARVAAGQTVPTADLTIHYLAPITIGPAVATARIVRQGRSRIVVQVDVHDSGRNVLGATATLTFAVLPARPTHPEWPPIVG